MTSKIFFRQAFLSKNKIFPVLVVTITVSIILPFISILAKIGGALISRFHKSCLTSWKVQIIFFFLKISNYQNLIHCYSHLYQQNIFNVLCSTCGRFVFCSFRAAFSSGCWLFLRQCMPANQRHVAFHSLRAIELAGSGIHKACVDNRGHGRPTLQESPARSLRQPSSDGFPE